jgi:hypothetical protein
VREGEESGGKKDNQMHLIKAYKARYKSDVKIDGKRKRKRRKKGWKKREMGEKGAERKMGNMYLLKHAKLDLNVT